MWTSFKCFSIVFIFKSFHMNAITLHMFLGFFYSKVFSAPQRTFKLTHTCEHNSHVSKFFFIFKSFHSQKTKLSKGCCETNFLKFAFKINSFAFEIRIVGMLISNPLNHFRCQLAHTHTPNILHQFPNPHPFATCSALIDDFRTSVNNTMHTNSAEWMD